MLAYANLKFKYVSKYKLKGLLDIKNLTSAKRFETVFVKDIIGEKASKSRLMELGITKGVKIFIKRYAPFGSPIEVVVRGYNLCLDKKSAENILIL